MLHIKNLMNQWMKKKVGTTNYFDLSASEKESYEAMERELTEHKITDDEVYTFFSKQIGLCEDQLINPDISDKARLFYTVELRVYRNIIKFLDAPKLKVRNARMIIESQLGN